MNRAEIAEKYKAVIERRLSKFRNDEAQEFYTKTLPNRLEQFRANYTGAPEKMEAAVEEEEEERVLDFWDYLEILHHRHVLSVPLSYRLQLLSVLLLSKVSCSAFIF